MLFALYYALNAIEAIVLAVVMVSIGSSAQESVFLNLSLFRLVLVGAIALIGLWFLFLAAGTIRGMKKQRALEERILGNEGGLWLAFGASILLICAGLFVLTRGLEAFGKYQMIYQRFEPVLVWVVIFGAQTAFFTALWYSAYFIGDGGQGEMGAVQKELMPLLGLFVGLVIIKMVLVTPTSYGPVGAGGEITYFNMAEAFYRGIFSPRDYDFYHYPPLYPLSLVITFVVKGQAFEGIKLLNNVFSSSIVFPVYFITRKFLDARKSLLAAFLACLIPFHLDLPRRMLSENLYFPLFLWGMYVVFVNPRNNKYRLVWDIMSGALIGVLYLTRYITLAAIPFFMLGWWVKPFEGEKSLFKPGWKKVLHFIIFGITTLAVFSPWVLLGIKTGVPIKYMLGFGITENSTTQQRTLIRLIEWAVLYAGYFILVAAPVLNLLIVSFFQVDTKRWREGLGLLIFQVLAVMAGFYAAVTRHSWRVLYNSGLPHTIMGRYLILFSVEYFIIALVTVLQFRKSTFRSKWHFIFFAQILPLLLVFFSYFAIIKVAIFQTDGELLRALGSVDASYIEMLGGTFFVLIFLIYTITNWLLWEDEKFRWRKPHW